VEHARVAERIILTPTALATAQRFGLLDHLVRAFDVVVPTSLLWQLRIEAAEAKAALATGRSTIRLADFGPHIEDVPAGDARLHSRLEAASAAVAWVEENTSKEPRPYASVRDTDSPEEEARERLGPASFDALVLAESGIGTLYADDLGLRRYTVGGGPRVDSFSTVSLLSALGAKGLLTEQEVNQVLADLVLAGYVWVQPSHGLLSEALRRMPSIGKSELQRLLSPLGGPVSSALEAAQMAARLIREAATTPLQTVGVDFVAEASIRAMAGRWHQPVAARLVQRQAQTALALLHPRYIDAVNRVAATLSAEAMNIRPTE
jgi:hypothetical protein